MTASLRHLDSFIKQRKRDNKRQNTNKKILYKNEKDKQNYKKVDSLRHLDPITGETKDSPVSQSWLSN